MKIFKLSLLFSLLLITSCTSQKKILDSWMGSDKQRIIRSWGPPSSITSDGGDGEILIWSEQYTGYSGYTYYMYTMMYADGDGKLYHWRYEKKSVPPTQINVRVY